MLKLPEPLTNNNFILYCAKHYNNQDCISDVEFLEDIKRIKYIKKLLFRYKKTNEIKERLILNHIIILNNVFGPEATVRILYLKCSQYLSLLNPFLAMLNILPETVYNINGVNIKVDLIEPDKDIVECLKSI